MNNSNAGPVEANGSPPGIAARQTADGSAAPLQADRRVPAQRGKQITFLYDGRKIKAYEGETIAAALLATGQRAYRTTSSDSEPRGLFCNMGVCFDCLVEVDGRLNQRACQRPVAEGMEVKSQHGTGQWETPK